jgi:hypothetical protein
MSASGYSKCQCPLSLLQVEHFVLKDFPDKNTAFQSDNVMMMNNFENNSITILDNENSHLGLYTDCHVKCRELHTGTICLQLLCDFR